MLMTAKSARKSPKTETTCAYQRRRIIGMGMTSPMERGAGSSGSMGGFGIDSAGAGLGEVVLMGGEFMVLDWGEIRPFAAVSFTKRTSAAKAAAGCNVIHGTHSTSLRAVSD